MNETIGERLQKLQARRKDTATDGLIEAWIDYLKRCTQLLFETSWIDDVTQPDRDASVLRQIKRLADEERWLSERSPH
jgi:hypothetical protein